MAQQAAAAWKGTCTPSRQQGSRVRGREIRCREAARSAQVVGPREQGRRRKQPLSSVAAAWVRVFLPSWHISTTGGCSLVLPHRQEHWALLGGASCIAAVRCHVHPELLHCPPPRRAVAAASNTRPHIVATYPMQQAAGCEVVWWVQTGVRDLCCKKKPNCTRATG